MHGVRVRRGVPCGGTQLTIVCHCARTNVCSILPPRMETLAVILAGGWSSSPWWFGGSAGCSERLARVELMFYSGGNFAPVFGTGQGVQGETRAHFLFSHGWANARRRARREAPSRARANSLRRLWRRFRENKPCSPVLLRPLQSTNPHASTPAHRRVSDAAPRSRARVGKQTSRSDARARARMGPSSP